MPPSPPQILLIWCCIPSPKRNGERAQHLFHNIFRIPHCYLIEGCTSTRISQPHTFPVHLRANRNTAHLLAAIPYPATLRPAESSYSEPTPFRPPTKITMFNLFAFTILLVASCASAHMSVTPAEVTPGGRATYAITISHDCGTDTIGTSNFTIAVPKGFVSVTVEDTPGWHTIIHKYKHKNVTIGTSSYNESVSAVEFHGFLPDGYYKSFGIKARAPMAKVGTKFWWSGFQDCHAKGTPLKWMSIPSEEDPSPRRPARATIIVAEEKK